MDSRYPPPSRSRRWMLVVASILATSGCSFDKTRPCADGQGGSDACACETPGASRCAGNTVQSCQRGGWTAQLECRGDEACVQGACMIAGTGCPHVAWVVDPTIVHGFAPVLVSDCLPGGNVGREAVYMERQSETRQRELILTLEGCPDPSLDFTEIFGMDVEASVSSEHMSSIQGSIPPDKFGAFYRQTLEIQHLALLLRYNDLGGQIFVGTALLTDYMYLPDFVTGDTCATPSSFSPRDPDKFCITWMDNCRCED